MISTFAGPIFAGPEFALFALAAPFALVVIPCTLFLMFVISVYRLNKNPKKLSNIASIELALALFVLGIVLYYSLQDSGRSELTIGVAIGFLLLIATSIRAYLANKTKQVR